MDDYVTRHQYARPWMNRTRMEPQKTYSGRVVYTRRKHYFNERDVARIMAKVKGTWEVERPTASALELALAAALAFWSNALELLSWIDPFGIAGRLQAQAQQIIIKLVTVDNEPWSPWVVMDLIQTLATKQRNFDVQFLWRP